MPGPAHRMLSESQLATLAEVGEERRAEVGEKLFEIGDASYPFIAIVEGEAAVLDAAGHEVIRHGDSGFLGEMNLLSGQTVFLTAVVTEPMRYIAVDREALRGLLFEDASLSDLLLPAFVQRREMLQQRQGVGVEVVGPRDSAETRRLLEFARRLRLPYSWLDPVEDAEAAAIVERTAPDELPLVRLPGGIVLRRPSNGKLSRALGIGLELAPREEVDLLVLCGAQRVGVVGGGNSAAQAAIWLARGGALVTLLHRRADLTETMSHYLIEELERYGVAVRDRSEVAELRGEEGKLEGVALTDGAELPFSFLFLFLGASPCTEWLGDAVARDEKGFVLTGGEAGADGLLETSLPGVYAAGDVRAGSIKRCATAVGEGATVVRFVHERLAAAAA
ncbi:MAG TPA: FAD-dependent oxidoreductase [Solirubrobacterales bacterium]|nr:FAD-dependent oxidoreductase [Solirubrobacterales bacterium]